MARINIRFTLFSAFYSPLISAMSGCFLKAEGLDPELRDTLHVGVEPAGDPAPAADELHSGHRPTHSTHCRSAKNAKIVKGNGDLTWHVDDGLGGHPVMCPLIQAGIQLDPANAANGQLQLLVGSHRYAKHWVARGEERDLPVVALETQPGDLTLHYGDTMHSTPPPTSDAAGRRALYYKFARPKTFDWIPARCHYNNVLFRRQPDGRVAAGATSGTY